MTFTVKIFLSCTLLCFSLSSMENAALIMLLKEHRNAAQSNNNSSLLILLNALKKAQKNKNYIEICDLNQEFLPLAATLPQPLKKLASEKFNTSSLYI